MWPALPVNDATFNHSGKSDLTKQEQFIGLMYRILTYFAPLWVLGNRNVYLLYDLSNAWDIHCFIDKTRGTYEKSNLYSRQELRAQSYCTTRWCPDVFPGHCHDESAPAAIPSYPVILLWFPINKKHVVT